MVKRVEVLKIFFAIFFCLNQLIWTLSTTLNAKCKKMFTKWVGINYFKGWVIPIKPSMRGFLSYVFCMIS